MKVTSVVTMYNRKDLPFLIIDTFNKKKNIYCNEKTEGLLKAAGVQFPLELATLLSDNDYRGIINKSQFPT